MSTDTTYSVPCIYPSIQAKTVPFAGPLTVNVPGSKSITNRALLLATLAKGTSCLRGALFSDDSRHFLQCIQDLGFEAEADEENCQITVKGLGGRIPRPEATVRGQRRDRRPLSHCLSRPFPRHLSYGCLGADAQASHGTSAECPEGTGL